MKNREEWRQIVQETKAHPELKRQGGKYFYLWGHLDAAPLTTKRHLTITLWMPIRLSATAPPSLSGCDSPRRDVSKRVLQNISVITHKVNVPDKDIFSSFSVWNWSPNFIRTFQLHPVQRSSYWSLCSDRTEDTYALHLFLSVSMSTPLKVNRNGSNGSLLRFNYPL
jgi:hypothetical protein